MTSTAISAGRIARNLLVALAVTAIFGFKAIEANAKAEALPIAATAAR